MKKILGIDLGQAVVGLALGDFSTRQPFPNGVFPRSKGTAEREIVRICANQPVFAVAIGFPTDQFGNATKMSNEVLKFCRRLSKRLTIPIHLVDEWGSSYQARELAAGRSSRDRIDDVAACLVLESFFEHPQRWPLYEAPEGA